MNDETPLEQYANLNVTILNVHTVHPRALAIWVDANLLNDRVPEFSGGGAPDLRMDIVPRLPVFANKLQLATALFTSIIGELCDAKENHKKVAKALGKGNEYELYKDRLEASKEILYRTCQALSTMYEGTSRSMTGIESFRLLQNRQGAY